MNLKYILIVIILAVILGGGILAYQYWWLPKEEAKPVEVKPPPEKIPLDETANWKIYEGDDYSIKYPPDWETKIHPRLSPYLRPVRFRPVRIFKPIKTVVAEESAQVAVVIERFQGQLKVKQLPEDEKIPFPEGAFYLDTVYSAMSERGGRLEYIGINNRGVKNSIALLYINAYFQVIKKPLEGESPVLEEFYLSADEVAQVVKTFKQMLSTFKYLERKAEIIDLEFSPPDFLLEGKNLARVELWYSPSGTGMEPVLIEEGKKVGKRNGNDLWKLSIPDYELSLWRYHIEGFDGEGKSIGSIALE